jgi:GTPase SAR1 family protein
LWLNGNKELSDLSPLKELQNLQILNVYSTQVSDLSPILSLIKKGIPVKWGKDFTENQVIDVRDCPLSTPPPNIVQQGIEAILNYFKELTGGEVKGLEAKVILVGEGQSGKTSLRTRLLRGEQAPLPKKNERTRGLEVEIEPYMVKLPSDEQMRLNIFDFGGQTHYKPLHQFFYSHRSLYVLVTKNGDDSNEFDFWFETAQLFGGGSPVLVVNNLFGDVQSGFNRSKFGRFEDIIKDSLSDNLLTPKDFPKIRKRIEQLAEDLPLVHQTIPKTWANVRRELEQLRSRNIISLEKYLDICAKPDNGEMDRDRALHCSAYLHDIGVCLHYQDFPSLKRHIIVKNEWATEAVYRVMDDPEVNKAHGHFDLDDLSRIWKPTAKDLARGEDFRYEEYQPELLELMRKFKLCYPLLKNEEEFVAPHLLPTKQEKDKKWISDNDLQFEMEYDFMPPGLFSRFIVSRYKDIAGENREFVWRDEVFFQWKEVTANVSLPSRAGKKAIVFKVKGNDAENRKFFLTWLIEDLKKLHAETPGILAEERIPCICAKCSQTESDKQFFEHSVLKDFLKEDVADIQCQKGKKMVSVSALLGNIFSTEKADKESLALDKSLIRKLLKNDDLEQALGLLEQHAPDECVLLQAQISRIRRSSGLGMSSLENERNVRQRTIQAVLD